MLGFVPKVTLYFFFFNLVYSLSRQGEAWKDKIVVWLPAKLVKFDFFEKNCKYFDKSTNGFKIPGDWDVLNQNKLFGSTQANTARSLTSRIVSRAESDSAHC